MIDLDQLIPNSSFFRWREAVFLPKWGIYGYPPPEVHANIIRCAKYVADPIRNLFGKPMQITSWWRPKNYNDWKTIGGVEYGVGGAPDSSHMRGLAIDFTIYTVSIDEIHAVLAPRLETMGIRMEKPDGRNRVHCDLATVPNGGSRYFLP